VLSAVITAVICLITVADFTFYLLLMSFDLVSEYVHGCICRDIIDIVGPAVEPQEYIARCHRYR